MNISDYKEGHSFDLKFPSATVYDNGKLDGSKIVSNNINY
jgi:hypothetical protein